MTRDVVLLGSTGSIGTQALEIVAANPDRFRVVALSAGGANLSLLADQVLATGAEHVAVADERVDTGTLVAAIEQQAAAIGLRREHWRLPEFYLGPRASEAIAAIDCDVVLNGVTGSVGLSATLAALQAGSTLALANKESLVVGGAVVTSAARPGQIVPVDSEHSALAQCLRGGAAEEVSRLILTASGGPFRGWSKEELRGVTLEQALAHPTWTMGPVVTINSATMMNKGLEIIEAHLLFDISMDRIEAVVHPQSFVHSMVEFNDGSTLAQASPPDMRLPISMGLAWPVRVPGAALGCDWTTAQMWEFLPLDLEAFPAVDLARRAGSLAGTAPAVFNAANEVAVAGFIAGDLQFVDIVSTVQMVLDKHLANETAEGSAWVPDASLTLEAVLLAERWARGAASAAVKTGTGA